MKAKTRLCWPGSAWMLGRFKRVESFLLPASPTVNLLPLLLTFASERGLYHNRQAKAWGLLVDRLTILVEGGGR
jgi:hypothetical protein